MLPQATENAVAGHVWPLGPLFAHPWYIPWVLNLWVITHMWVIIIGQQVGN